MCLLQFASVTEEEHDKSAPPRLVAAWGRKIDDVAWPATTISDLVTSR